MALLDDLDQLRALARQTLERGYSVRELEGKTRAAKGRAVRSRVPGPRAEAARDDIELEHVRQRLQTALATAVRVKPRGSGGVIEVEYYDADDLARILEHIEA